MRTLAELQAGLALRLTSDPAAETDPQLGRAARALQHKRMRAAAQLLPRTRREMESEWARAFLQHAMQYTPGGLLYHVDDAWEFARAQSSSKNRRIRRAARLDLMSLKLRFARSSELGAWRVVERTRFYLFLSLDPLALALRIPGRRPLFLTQ